jgi:hypothetical protein
MNFEQKGNPVEENQLEIPPKEVAVEKGVLSIEDLQDDYFKKRILWLEALAEEKRVEQLDHDAMNEFLANKSDLNLREKVNDASKQYDEAKEKTKNLSLAMNKVGDAIAFESKDADPHQYPTTATRNIELVEKRIAEERPELAALLSRKE